MTMQEVQAKMKAAFGDAIGDWSEPAAGDGFIVVGAEHLHDVCHFLRDDPAMQFDYLRLISGVDWTDRLGSVYHLYSYPHGHDVVLHVNLDRTNPRVASVMDLWPAAEWHEREAYDMIGIVYEGHDPLVRILLPDDWEGYPLRKDYAAPKEYHGLTNE